MRAHRGFHTAPVMGLEAERLCALSCDYILRVRISENRHAAHILLVAADAEF